MCQHEEGWNKKITRGVLEPLLCSGPLLLLWSVLLFLINYSFTNAKKKKRQVDTVLPSKESTIYQQNTPVNHDLNYAWRIICHDLVKI